MGIYLIIGIVATIIVVLFLVVGAVFMLLYCKDTASVPNRGKLVMGGTLFVAGNLALGIAYCVCCLLSSYLRPIMIQILIRYLVNAPFWFYFRIQLKYWLVMGGGDASKSAMDDLKDAKAAAQAEADKAKS